MADAVPDDHPVVLFDGVCNLCTGFVTFLIPRDPEGVLRFASLQSEVGAAALDRFDLPTGEFDSIVLVEGDDYYTKSSAALRIAYHLGGVYRLLYALRVVPRPVRDAVYDLVANHRYQVFGRKDACMVPTPDVQSRFLDQ
ncbi:MAG: thiol-disulfide oxidoreductase DCC family protein [Halobacteriaceae archaeon]